MDIKPRVGLVINAKCIDVDVKGWGLAKWNNFVIIAKDLLPSEIAELKLLYRKRSIWVAEVQKHLSISAHRVTPICSVADECGGCSLQHLAYNSQIDFKKKYIHDVFSRIAGIDIKLKRFIYLKGREFGYRNRAIIPVRRISSGLIQLGYYKHGTHEIIDINSCPVLDNRLNKYIYFIRQDLQDSYIQMDPDSLSDCCIRHIAFRIGHHTGEVLITIISNTANINGLDIITKKWAKRWPEVKGITNNIQPYKNNKLFGSYSKLLHGQDYILEEVCGIRLKLNSTSFFQINTIKAEAIISIITQWFLNNHQITTVIDAYCGVGTISLPLCKQGFNIIGIEIDQHSVDLAHFNLKLNKLKNGSFYAGDVEQNINNLMNSSHGLILDPPRKGLSQKMIDLILMIKPSKIAYLSCNPSTLARDIDKLTKGLVYQICDIQPIDFFPQTTHVECLALLERVSTLSQL